MMLGQSLFCCIESDNCKETQHVVCALFIIHNCSIELKYISPYMV